MNSSHCPVAEPAPAMGMSLAALRVAARRICRLCKMQGEFVCTSQEN